MAHLGHLPVFHIVGNLIALSWRYGSLRCLMPLYDYYQFGWVLDTHSQYGSLFQLFASGGKHLYGAVGLQLLVVAAFFELEIVHYLEESGVSSITVVHRGGQFGYWLCVVFRGAPQFWHLVS